MEKTNQNKKPITNSGTNPYKTPIVSIAEQFSAVRKTSTIDLENLADEGLSKITKRKKLPFKPSALAKMKDQEILELKKSLQKYREEEASRYKMWEKDVTQFKQNIKKRTDKFAVALNENIPLVFKRKSF